MKKIVTLFAVCALAGCATIKHGPSQTIYVSTHNKVPAMCELSNQRGHWKVKAPAHVKVSRARSPLKIECYHGSHAGNVVLESKFQKKALLGGVSGVTIDAATGSGYQYPEHAEVTLSPMKR